MRASNGTRIINGKYYVLSGLDDKEGAKKTASSYRSKGASVRVIQLHKYSHYYQVWVLGGDL